jgi:Family of unknown function (DUF5681)
MTDVGYGTPPNSTRYRKGQSGNPKGRPRGRHNQPPYEAVLGQMVTIKEDGLERRVTAAEAFLLQITKRGLDGDGTAARLAMTAIEEARASGAVNGGPEIRALVTVLVTPGSVNPALERLRMATKLDRYRAGARMMIEPWLVETAISRLGDRRLSLEEQEVVVRAVRNPSKVRWPHWWTVRFWRDDAVSGTCEPGNPSLLRSRLDLTAEYIEPDPTSYRHDARRRERSR